MATKSQNLVQQPVQFVSPVAKAPLSLAVATAKSNEHSPGV